MNGERPAGVTTIASLGVVLAVAAVTLAGLIWAGRLPLSAGASLLGGGLEQLGPVAFLLYALLTFLLAVALWRRRRWARRVAILIAVIGIALYVPSISSAVMDTRIFAIGREGLQIIVRVLVIFYLSQEPVKAWFDLR